MYTQNKNKRKETYEKKKVGFWNEKYKTAVEKQKVELPQKSRKISFLYML